MGYSKQQKLHKKRVKKNHSNMVCSIQTTGTMMLD